MHTALYYCFTYFLNICLPFWLFYQRKENLNKIKIIRNFCEQTQVNFEWFYFNSASEVVSYWRKYVHEVLVNRLGGLSLPRKSVVRLTDRPNMTLDVYRGRKTTIQQQSASEVVLNAAAKSSCFNVRVIKNKNNKIIIIIKKS